MTSGPIRIHSHVFQQCINHDEMEDQAMKKTSIIMVSLAVVLLTLCVTATASQLFDKKTTITVQA